MKWLHILRRWFQNGARLAAAALAFVCLLTCLQSGALAAKTQAVSQGTDGAALMFNVYQNTDQVYEILDILSDKDVKATFFVGGIWAQQNPDALLAIEQIVGHHYELDDFQIQTVTEGREAMGSALVRLRSGGKLYSGNGISTDIIGSSIRAYMNALNKIKYEESQV